ncbi:protein of unknown function [Burkholderia sp. D7]|nr:protein of unknown function [Burkholderia sp. D7]
MEQVNPWAKLVLLLSHLPMQGEKADVKPLSAVIRQLEVNSRNAVGQREATPGTGHKLKITEIERRNDKSAFISCCGPTMGHYADQLWILAKAPRVGRCALTGQGIKKGDHVFRPSTRNRSLPANCNEMILATALSPEDFRF